MPKFPASPESFSVRSPRNSERLQLGGRSLVDKFLEGKTRSRFTVFDLSSFLSLSLILFLYFSVTFTSIVDEDEEKRFAFLSFFFFLFSIKLHWCLCARAKTEMHALSPKTERTSGR